MHVRVMVLVLLMVVVVEMEVVVGGVVLLLLRLGRGWLTIVEQRGGFRLRAAASGIEALQGGVHVIHQGLQINVILWGTNERKRCRDRKSSLTGLQLWSICRDVAEGCVPHQNMLLQ